jgi:hypothetical protein
MDDDILRLSSKWLFLKNQERDAVNARRQVEDELIQLVKTTPDGSATTTLGNLNVKVTGRMNRRVDGDLLQDLAAEHGLTDHLGTLFRWKPDINLAAWKAADPSITEPLLDAITTSEGRPSFNITNER